jgi:hypothetical protein
VSISGTFTARFLSKYDAGHCRHRPDDNNDGAGEGVTTRDCLLNKIIVYDISPPPVDFCNDDHNPEGNDGGSPPSSSSLSSLLSLSSQFLSSSSSNTHPLDWQGSRVASATLLDGSVVELGALIVYDGNSLVMK